MGEGTREKTPAKSPRGSKSPTPPAAGPAGPSSPGDAPTEAPAGILPATHWAQGDVEDDRESAMGESVNSATTSMTASILNYRTLHGRRYHSEVGNASYWGTNDEQQNESMDINHYALTLGCGDKLHLAPLDEDKLQRVLDIGTGTGIWAIDFADTYPMAQVTGTDISPIQPSWVPPNLKFEIEDCTLDWTFPPASTDYIHMRWLLGSIPDWTALFKEAYKTCRPGGWVESLEPSAVVESDHCDIPKESALGQWGMFFVEGGKMIGRSFTVVQDELQRKGMEEAGFVDIQEYDFKMPLGNWPKEPVLKELGTVGQLVLESDVEGYILFMANTLGWSRDEIQVYIAHLRREVRSKRFFPYYRQKVIWGRKPE